MYTKGRQAMLTMSPRVPVMSSPLQLARRYRKQLRISSTLSRRAFHRRRSFKQSGWGGRTVRSRSLRPGRMDRSGPNPTRANCATLPFGAPADLANRLTGRRKDNRPNFSTRCGGSFFLYQPDIQQAHADGRAAGESVALEMREKMNARAGREPRSDSRNRTFYKKCHRVNRAVSIVHLNF